MEQFVECLLDVGNPVTEMLGWKWWVTSLFLAYLAWHVVTQKINISLAREKWSNQWNLKKKQSHYMTWSSVKTCASCIFLRHVVRFAIGNAEEVHDAARSLTLRNKDAKCPISRELGGPTDFSVFWKRWKTAEVGEVKSRIYVKIILVWAVGWCFK